MPRRRKSKDRPPPRLPGEVRKVYIETSVWGMTVPGQPPALRQPTIEFSRQCAAGYFQVFVSQVVLDEMALAPLAAVEHMRYEIERLAPPILEAKAECDELAQAYLTAGVIPAKKRDDARHVAVATIARIELVLSWNHKHLANDRKWALFNATNLLAGYDHELRILTPFEAMR
jgi:hypothetical protein